MYAELWHRLPWLPGFALPVCNQTGKPGATAMVASVYAGGFLCGHLLAEFLLWRVLGEPARPCSLPNPLSSTPTASKQQRPLRGGLTMQLGTGTSWFLQAPSTLSHVCGCGRSPRTLPIDPEHALYSAGFQPQSRACARGMAPQESLPASDLYSPSLLPAGRPEL